MQAVLSLLGLLIAIVVWNTGHPVLAVLVGVLLVGGAGWMLPIWLARGIASSRMVQPKNHARLDALLIEWRARTGDHSTPPTEMAQDYLDGFGTRWHSPAQFMDVVMKVVETVERLESNNNEGVAFGVAITEDMIRNATTIPRVEVLRGGRVNIPTGFASLGLLADRHVLLVKGGSPYAAGALVGKRGQHATLGPTIEITSVDGVHIRIWGEEQVDAVEDWRKS